MNTSGATPRGDMIPFPGIPPQDPCNINESPRGAAPRVFTGGLKGVTLKRYKTWTLTDIHHDIWLDTFATGSDRLTLGTTGDWSIHKRTLRGGLRDGVDLIEVNNGALSYAILPTRG